MTDDARHNAMNIAITGIGGIFPSAPDPDSFWRMIASGQHGSRPVPQQRWPVPPESIHDPGEAVRDRTRSIRACLLDPLDFDPGDYGLPPDLLTQLDPLFHLTLMAGHQAWSDQSGQLPDLHRTGIILGNIALPTETLSRMTQQQVIPAIQELVTGIATTPADLHQHHPLNTFPAGLPAGLLARSLGITGGWQTLDAACASSLYAIKLAATELLTGRLDAVISGGLGRPDSLYTQMGFSQLRAISPSGICSPFDSNADGLVVGEGAGLVVLRRLQDAINGGHHIYGIIQGIGFSNDIGGSLFAPDSEGQTRAIRQAYDCAGWTPGDIDLVECHGTGTPVGDAVEFNSMKTVWNDAGVRESGRCVIGSVKSNVGHLLTGAGGAGLLKVLLAFKNETLPPTANYQSPSHRIELHDSPFRILRNPEPWKTRSPETPRRAAVSAFGFGGINAHLLIESYHPDIHNITTKTPENNCSIEINDSKNIHASVAIVGLAAAAGAWPDTESFQDRLLGIQQDKQNNKPVDLLKNSPLIQSTWFKKNVIQSRERKGYPLNPSYIPIGRFRIPPAELREMLPQQLLMLKTAGEALSHGAWRDDHALESGVFIGIGLDINTTNFQVRWCLDQDIPRWMNSGTTPLSASNDTKNAIMDTWSRPLTANGTMGALGGIVASRIARAFRIGGAGFTVSSETTSGIKALETAVRMIQNGDIRQAIVGAVDMTTDWRETMASAHLHLPDSDGTFSDGAVALILKPLADAEADNDTILAVIDNVITVAEQETANTVEQFPGHIVTENIGWTGAAHGLMHVAGAVIGLHHRLLPGNMVQGPEYWLRNAENGPRSTRITLDARDGNPVSVKLTEHEPSRDKPLKLPLPAGGFQKLIPSKIRDRLLNSRPGNPSVKPGSTAFVYAGSGSHRPGQGRRLSWIFRHILDDLDRESARLKDQFQPDLYWNQPDRTVMDEDPHGLIVGHVTYCFFLTELLRRAGAQPGASIGYSLGESSGLVALRIWPDRDAVLQKLESTNLFTEALGGPCTALLAEWELPPGVFPDWRMAIVNLSASDITQRLNGWPRIYLLIRNTADQCVIGGHGPDLDRFLHENSLANTSLPVTGVTVAHVPAVHEVAEDYLALHYWPIHNPRNLTVYSGAWKKAYPVKSETCSEAILAHATEGIDFPATIEAAYADGISHFVEIGPGNACSNMIRRILAGRGHTTSAMEPTAPNDTNQPNAFLGLLKTMADNGWPMALDNLLTEPATDWQPETDEAKNGIPCHSVPETRPFPTIKRPTTTTAAPIPSRLTPAVATPTTPDLPPVSEGATPSIRLARQLDRTTTAVNRAQTEFLELSRRWTASMEQLISFQSSLLPALPITRVDDRVFMDRTACLEFARGSIATVLGEAFAEADRFPPRVRLPDEPLMLVDRIISVEGKPRSMTHGRVITEHDVHHGSWYLDQGRCPVCITVEAGQADLFLSGYLGIDFETRGIQKYRLLDAEITNHRGLPVEGETIRYDIRITRFFRQGGVWLFKFEYDATINGQPMLTMRNGCAGFFSDNELDAGQGIVKPRLDATDKPSLSASSSDHIFVNVSTRQYDSDQLECLRKGDLAGCFGQAFSGVSFRKPPRLPGGRMQLIDRIVEIDPCGGAWGLGFVKAEADIDPNAWFLTCHFVDDMVMPGTLMYECCFHAFRVLLMQNGWIGEEDGFAWDPRPGVTSKLKCRGQVIQSTKTAGYEITVKEIGFEPAPYAIADALMFADGRPVVEIQDMSVQLNGLSRHGIEKLWANQTPDPVIDIYDKATIMAFSNGKPSEAFGDRYKIFDGDTGRVIARLPGPPYQFLDRVVNVTSPPWEMSPGGTVVAEYDVPETDWYFDANGVSGMPFSVLLEIALQPCGWYSAYMGSALHSDVDLSYRNLGGNGVIHRLPEPGAGKISIAVDSTRISKSGGMIIQNFDFRVYDDSGDLYTGDTYFGFFTRAALADQVGIREESLFESSQPVARRNFPSGPALPESPLRMMDEIVHLELDGGPDSIGFIEGRKQIDPEEWFFKAHFYQDPVWPGSLGLEAMLQLMQVFAREKWGDTLNGYEFTRQSHQWVYRGQVIPTDKEVTVQAIVTGIDEETRTIVARGYLSIDGRLIYSMKNFGLRFKSQV